jgi:hypothetical protein
MIEEPQGSRRSYINSRRVSFCKGTPDGSGAILLMVSIFSKKSPPAMGVCLLYLFREEVIDTPLHRPASEE